MRQCLKYKWLLEPALVLIYTKRCITNRPLGESVRRLKFQNSKFFSESGQY